MKALKILFSSHKKHLNQEEDHATIVEDDEMLFSKNNICVHPIASTSSSNGIPHHNMGYLTVTAQPDFILGHTLLLSWRPNEILLNARRSWSKSASDSGCRCRHGSTLSAFSSIENSKIHDTSVGDISLSSTVKSPLDTADVDDINAQHKDKANRDTSTPLSCQEIDTHSDVLPNGLPTLSVDCYERTTPETRLIARNNHLHHAEQLLRRNGSPTDSATAAVPNQEYASTLIECSGHNQCNEMPNKVQTSDLALHLQDGTKGDGCSESNHRLHPASCYDGDLRRLSTQSAPPSPNRPDRNRSNSSTAPTSFTIDIGRARSVRLFPSPDDGDSGQLVVCSRQSEYRVLHFHCGGLNRLLKLFESWSHLLSSDESGGSHGCRFFSVCSGQLDESEEHPEEGQYCCLTPEVWSSMQNADGSVEDPDTVRNMVFFGGLDARLRPVVWPLLLGVTSFMDSDSERAERLDMLREEFHTISEAPDRLVGPSRTEFQRLVVSTVDKDVVRTDPGNPFFGGAGNRNVATLRRILLAFAAENPTVGYTQGMSDLLAPLLVTFGDPTLTYWCFDALITRSRAVVCPRDDVVDAQMGYLRELLRLLLPKFYDRLAALEDGLELLFTHRWLLLCFRREFGDAESLRVWEACWSSLSTRHFSLFVAAAVCAVYGAALPETVRSADAVILHFTSLSHVMSAELVLRKARGLLHQFLSLEAIPCSLVDLCVTSDDPGSDLDPWNPRRVTRVICRGHESSDVCPAASDR